MKVFYTPHFRRSFRLLSRETKQKFKKQIIFLLKDFYHPLLRVKKYDEKRGIWQARVDKAYRFYFKIENDFYILLEIIEHP